MNNETSRSLEKCWYPLHQHEKGESDMRVLGCGVFLISKAYAYLKTLITGYTCTYRERERERKLDPFKQIWSYITITLMFTSNKCVS
jgi:hypothetical protein